MIEALSSGDLVTSEEAAQKNYAPAFLDRSSESQRAAIFQRVYDDFGAIQIVERSETETSVHLLVSGEKGLDATFEFEFTPGDDTRIDKYQMMVGRGAGQSDVGGIQLPPPPINAAMSVAEMERGINMWMTPVIDHDDFSGVIAISKNGAPYVTLAYGVEDRVAQRPTIATTPFNIASIGKKFTQTAIAKLIQEGSLTLSSTIGELLPDYPNAEAHSATIDQLVNFRAGVADFFGPEFEALPKSKFQSNHDFYMFVSALPQNFAPGSRTEYCNGCYVILGEIIERITGMTFEDNIQKVVFEPASMTSTGYFHRDDASLRLAIPYARPNGPGSEYVDAREGHPIAGSGAGGVYSTASDLLAFDRSLRDGTLLNKQWTDWVVGGDTNQDGVNTSASTVAGGAPGVNSLLQSNGRWAVAVVSNVDAPIPDMLGKEIANSLGE